ncbi:MAG: iron-sulfur cluster assembly accessory protein [Rhodospirillales bacterium]|nr:iron-sulfur cluster assembly accessory protein [Alphaproteobacteria bacterium]USO03413.1 MAG: iron-sulfur cluster assembly accessory protein [Rhodospirillales bacterium]
MTQAVKITDAAVKAIKAKTALNPGAAGLRLSIRATGCSGHSYRMEHVLEEDLTADERFAQGGAVLYIPKIHSWMLYGMEIDYAEDKMGAGFVFTNPNESARCGCGESFAVAPPENQE